MKSREISTWKRGGQKAENISLTKNDDAPVVVVAPDSRKIVVVVVVVGRVLLQPEVHAMERPGSGKGADAPIGLRAARD